MQTNELIQAAYQIIAADAFGDYNITPSSHAQFLAMKAPSSSKVLTKARACSLASQYEFKNSQATDS